MHLVHSKSANEGLGFDELENKLGSAGDCYGPNAAEGWQAEVGARSMLQFYSLQNHALGHASLRATIRARTMPMLQQISAVVSSLGVHIPTPNMSIYPNYIFVPYACKPNMFILALARFARTKIGARAFY